MNRDPLQRVVLAELGLTPYRWIGSDPGVELEPALLRQLAAAAGVSVEALAAERELLALAGAMGRDPQRRRALWWRLRALRHRSP